MSLMLVWLSSIWAMVYARLAITRAAAFRVFFFMNLDDVRDNFVQLATLLAAVSFVSQIPISS